MLRRLALLLLLLGFVPSVGAETLSISHIPYNGRLLFSKHCIYINLKSVAEEMKMKLMRSGFGYWAGYSPPDTLPSIPRGYVMVGSKVIPLIMPVDTGEYFVSAEAFCVNLNGKAEWSPNGDLALIRPGRPEPKYIPPEELEPANLPQAPAQSPRDPGAFFITQYRSAANADAGLTNGNCGPTTLAMIALAHHRLPPGIRADNPQGLILWCRECMTGNSLDQDEGTKLSQMRKAASQLGLVSQWVDDQDQLDWELRKGRLVAVSGDVNKIGFKVSGNGGHAILVVERRGDHYIVNDPGGFYPMAGSSMPAEQMKKFFWLGASFRTPHYTSQPHRANPRAANPCSIVSRRTESSVASGCLRITTTD